MTERCFICGDDNPTVLQEHHILPRRYGGGDSDDNLVTLCANCHEAVEKIYDDQFYERAGYSATARSQPVNSDTVNSDTARIWAKRFLEACDEVVLEGMVAKRALYGKYLEWAEQHDAPCPAFNVFGKAVANCGYGEIESTQRRINGAPTYVYTGVHVQD